MVSDEAGTLMELLPADVGEMGEVSGIRGAIAKLSARIDGQIPRFIWANVPIVASVAGLVLAAAKLV